MPEFRRGLDAIEQAAESRGGGNFRPFVPRIEWREDGEKKYILVLTPIDEVPTVSLHEWIPVGTAERADGETYTKYETFMARTEEAIGESHDRLTDELNCTPRERSIGVAVELEPVFENVKGRQKAKGFSVKTDVFTRKGEDDNDEEVTYPVLGLVIQSPRNFWGSLGSFDQSQGPLIELPMEIVRRGRDANTRYDFLPYMDVPVDLGPLVENVGGISYLNDDLEELVNQLEATGGDVEASQVVANVLLEKRLDELSDKDRYDDLTSGIVEIEQKFGGKKQKAKPRSSRPARASQRKPASNGGDSEPEAKGSDRASRFAALRAQVEQ